MSPVKLFLCKDSPLSLYRKTNSNGILPTSLFCPKDSTVSLEQ